MRGLLSVVLVLLLSCAGKESEEKTVEEDSGADTNTDTATDTDTDASTPQDIRDARFTDRSPACGDYVGEYTAAVSDLQSGEQFTASVQIVTENGACSITSNGIPNHDFNRDGRFNTPVVEITETFDIILEPTAANEEIGLTLQYDNGIFRNGVKLDLLAAACYGMGTGPLGSETGGCGPPDTPWRYDPMHPSNQQFGEDEHHAHTQPDGAYHYHGDPVAMYDLDGAEESGLIGWAADGFPIYGPFIDDGGTIRMATSGYTLKQGARESQPGEGAFPGGEHDGTFRDDWEFTGAGDLDECNGMTRNGKYAYYVSDGFPWVMGCFRGRPDESFRKGGGG